MTLSCMAAPGLRAAEPTVKTPQSQASTDVPVLFQEVTKDAAMHFQHINGATPERYMPETMGSGGLFFDYDNDGWLDIFLVDGGSLVDEELARRARSLLYKNERDGTFRDTTAHAGLKNPGYGMGACAADFNNDGWADLYLTNVGPNILYRNNGNGTFTDVTQKAGVGADLWSSSCAFADIDRDGDLDLYVANYVDFAVNNNKYCGDHVKDVRAYCHPNVYNGLPDVLYRNNGNGTFTDITREAGIYNSAGKGLGVKFGDYDNDGWTDIHVANDSVPNFLYQNQGNGTFKEVGLWAGVSVNGEGRPEAGMGTDLGDYDNDGLLDIFVTNLDMETNTLYRNLGDDLFTDVTFESGHGEPSLRYVGFGTAFFELDNDGDLDMIVANGHILDNATHFRDNIRYAQRNLLFRNEGEGTFKEVGLAAGPGFALEKVSRGLAIGDIDNDGDLDLLITNNGQMADLLLNDGGNQNHALVVRTIGTKSNRDGIGARLQLTNGSHTQMAEVQAGSGYLGQNDLRVHFGLGKASRVDRLDVHWPSGAVDTFENLEANQILTVKEGEGVVGREPFARPAAISGKVSGKADSVGGGDPAKEFP